MPLAIVSFLRNSSHLDILARDLQSRGLDGAASVIKTQKIKIFQAWRWSTLSNCCKSVDKIWYTFKSVFDATVFQKNRDLTSLGKICSAIGQESFTTRFKLVTWIANWMSEIGEWIGGCSCHEEEHRAGMVVDCFWKGRRLEDAYDYAL